MIANPHSPDIVLLDVNAFGYSSMYVPALAKLKQGEFLTGGIHGGLGSIFSVMSQYPNALPVVLWDRRAMWRYEIYPNYKSNRGNTKEKLFVKESYRKQAPIIQLILNSLGIPQVSCGEAEADDLAGVICRNIDPSWSITLSTHDTDWFQSIGNNVVWQSPRHKEIIVDLAYLADPNNTLDCHFLSPQEYIQAKALAGDDSDAITGVDGVGLKTAVKYMRAHGGSIENFWAAVDAGQVTPKAVAEKRLATQESRDIYHRNMKIMDWSKSPEIKTDMLALTAGKPDWIEAQHIADEYGLNKTFGKAQVAMKEWASRGWGDALWAVDAALNANFVPQKPKSNQVALA